MACPGSLPCSSEPSTSSMPMSNLSFTGRWARRRRSRPGDGPSRASRHRVRPPTEPATRTSGAAVVGPSTGSNVAGLGVHVDLDLRHIAGVAVEGPDLRRVDPLELAVDDLA